MSKRSEKRAIESLKSESNVNEVKRRRKLRSHTRTENDVAGISMKKHDVCPSENKANSEDTNRVQLRKRKPPRITLKEVTNNVTDAPKPTKIKRHYVNTKDEHFPVTSTPICEKFESISNFRMENVAISGLEVDGMKLEKKHCGFLIFDEKDEHSHHELSVSKPTDSFDRGACSNGNPEDLEPMIKKSNVNDTQSDTVTKNEGILVIEEKQDYDYLETANIEQQTDDKTSTSYITIRKPRKIQNTPRKLTRANLKSDSRISRKELPNLAILHQKLFDKMESLDECQERKAKRFQMLAAGTSNAAKDQDSEADNKQVAKKHTVIPNYSGYTRFGYKKECDVNPFDNGAEKVAAKPRGFPNALKRQPMLSSLAGTITRKEIAKQTVMREKSVAEKIAASRKDNRTIIKGVRMNRRFELQMQMRNIK